MNKDIEFLYDINKCLFVDEKSGYILSAEYVMMEDDEVVIQRIKENTGVDVDDFFVEVLRDTVESCTYDHYPWK